MTWNALPNLGFENGQVLAMAVIGTDLFVGGYFMQTGDGALTNLGNIARYDTVNHSWHALANHGLSAAVYALEVSGSDLYVGGTFTMSGDGTHDDLISIARYDTVTDTWHALASQGLVWDANNNYAVHAMAVSGDGLFVGGGFSRTGDGTLTDLGNIARYDTTHGTWSALPNEGVNHLVTALEMAGSDLYVGGRFTETGDGESELRHIARYSATWSALPSQGLAGDTAYGVNALALAGDYLYVGGRFTQTSDGTLVDLGNVARYRFRDSTWHSLPSRGVDDMVYTLAVDGTDLFVGGYLTQTGDGALTDLGRIVRFDSTTDTWHAMPDHGLAAVGAGVCKVDAMAVHDSDLYVGGGFTHAGDGTPYDLGGIVRFGTPKECMRCVYLPRAAR